MKKRVVVLGVLGIIFLSGVAYYYVALVPRIRAGREEGQFLDPLSRASVSALRFETNKRVKGISELSGRVVLVNVWASWCPPCVEGIPELVALAKEHEGSRFAIVALSVDTGGWQALKPFLKKHPEINYTIAVPSPAPTFLFETIVDLNPLGEVAALPTFFVIDQEGRLAGKFVGAHRFPEVRALVKQVLMEGSLGNIIQEVPRLVQ